VSVSPSSTVTVIGREAELAAAERFLESLSEGPAALVVEGEPGIGKTTVWREAIREAEEASYRVLSCRPAEPETKLSFSSLTDLTGAVADEVLPHLPKPQRRALEGALLRTEVASDVLDHRAVAAGFLSTLTIMGQTTPVLVGVDDVQWLDQPSRRVLEFAVRRLGGAPVGVLVTQRAEGEVPVPLRLDRATAENRFERLRLGPLSTAAIHQLVKQSLDLSLPRPTLVKLQRASGGNPFYAVEIATALREGLDDPTTPGRLPVPGAVSDLVSQRIRKLPAPTKDALLEASGLAQPTVTLVDERALELAEEAGLITVAHDGRITFRHPIFAAAVYDAAAAPRRRALHRRLAERVEDVEERARHLALATTEPDGSVAGILDLAAARARSRGAPDAAAELAEEACRLTPPDQKAALRRRLIDAGGHHFWAGDLSRARAVLSVVAADPGAGKARAEALMLLGTVCHSEYSVPEALDCLERARLEARDDVRLEVRIDNELTFVHNLVGDFSAVDAPVRRALAKAERLGEPDLLAETLAVSAIADFLLGRGVDDRIERALALEDPDSQIPVHLRPSLIASHLDFYTGRLDRAAERFRAVRRRLIERGEDSDLTHVTNHLAWLECWRGDLDAAAAHVEESLELSDQLESEALRAQALAFGALVHAYRGEAEATRSTATEGLTLLERTGALNGVIWALAGLGMLELSLGDYEAAHHALGPPLEEIDPAGLREPIVAFYVPDTVEALIGLGDLQRAEPLIGMLESNARRLDRQWARASAARCRGKLLATQGDIDAALRVFDEARALYERTGIPIELARTLLAKGQIERRARRKGRARDSLQQAQATFERHGARLWADRASSELDSLGLRRTEGDELSPAERRVAELAASGSSNREIAVTLFMSPKTVEAHLTHSYRKLGIHSRAQLGTRLAGAANGTQNGRETPDSSHPARP
jgi:DNA-binding CsgD family transcriptional regulator/tetratricopeptide (TPR) repeat protein